MSLLTEYMRKEQILNQLRDELQNLEANQELQQELEFMKKIEELIEQYGKTKKQVAELLDPERGTSSNEESKSSNTSTGTRKKRKLKVYKNPETGEVVETRGGNHKTLKAWKEEYGAEVVDQWLEDERDS